MSMDTYIESLRKRCISALSAVGATNEQCAFYAEALKCEYETMYWTYRLLTELRRNVSQSPMDVEFLVSTILKMSKNFIRWKSELESLRSQCLLIKPLGIDLKQKENNELLTALCTLKTKEVNLREGDEYRITDTSQPDMLKVLNSRGEEGYIPALSCLLPTPDNNAISTVERLHIQLLACWTDCEAKIRPLIQQAITVSSAQLLKQWSNCSINRRSGLSNNNMNAWDGRVSRRVKRITEVAQNQTIAIDLNRLRKMASSLENELLWQGSDQLTSMIETVANLDRVILSYQAFRKQWRNFRQSLKDCARPINIITNWDPAICLDPIKSLRYYEVKLTAEETETNEETSYVATTRESSVDDVSSTSGASQRESVAAEQLTSRSHEENKRFVVRSVIDPRDGSEISIQEAVAAGIVDHREGVYQNPDTGLKKSIPAAISEGLIQVEYVTATKSEEQVQSIGLITIRTQTDNREYTISKVIDATTGEKVDMEKARKTGIINEVAGYYVDGRTGKHILLDDAIETGWIEVVYGDDAAEQPATQYETKTYAISAVVDQRLHKTVSFLDAIRSGLIDRDTGNYINNATGEKVFAAEAIRRGFFKSKVVDNPQDLDIDVSNRVVVDRIDKVRKNILRSVRLVAALNHAMAQKDSGSSAATANAAK